jgi:hypothetical protein
MIVEKCYDRFGFACYKMTINNQEYFVPLDEANKDYQEILEWVAEGNTITDNGGSE